MFLIALSLIAGAVALAFGAVILQAISAIPLSILACAEKGGRYVRLGARDSGSPATPAAGRGIRILVPAQGHAA